jgi:hypothetical protein
LADFPFFSQSRSNQPDLDAPADVFGQDASHWERFIVGVSETGK